MPKAVIEREKETGREGGREGERKRNLRDSEFLVKTDTMNLKNLSKKHWMFIGRVIKNIDLVFKTMRIIDGAYLLSLRENSHFPKGVNKGRIKEMKERV